MKLLSHETIDFEKEKTRQVLSMINSPKQQIFHLKNSSESEKNLFSPSIIRCFFTFGTNNLQIQQLLNRSSHRIRHSNQHFPSQTSITFKQNNKQHSIQDFLFLRPKKNSQTNIRLQNQRNKSIDNAHQLSKDCLYQCFSSTKSIFTQQPNIRCIHNSILYNILNLQPTEL